MTSRKTQKQKFNGMSYHEVQRSNSENRSKLSKENQKWLKNNKYRNVGWVNVINLYKKIEELLEKKSLEDLTLEELFLEAERVGNKYLTTQEIEAFNQVLSKELSKVENEIEKSFPDTDFEVVDYSVKSKVKKNKKKL
jgi:hypothetical protein